MFGNWGFKGTFLDNMVQMQCIWNVIERAVTTLVIAGAVCGLVMSGAQGDLVAGKPSDITDPRLFDALLVAKLSSVANQHDWSQLIEQPWHDSAVDRFFVTGGPLDGAQVRQHPNMTWERSNITTSISDLIQKLQQLATTEYQMNTSIPGMGHVHASLWTLMFLCSSQDCTYLVPMVVVPCNGSYSYASVWHRFTAATRVHMLINASPASIKSTPTGMMSIRGESSISKPRHTTLMGLLESIFFNIHHVPLCEPDFSRRHYRALLDTTYGLNDRALNCIMFRNSSFKILLLEVGLEPFQRITENELFVNRSSVSVQPLDQCRRAPVVFTMFGPITMCHQNECVQFTTHGHSYRAHNYTLQHVLKGMFGILKYYIKSKLSNDHFNESFTPYNCSGPIRNDLGCLIQKVYYIEPLSDDYVLDDGDVNGDLSEWASSKGVNAHEFHNPFHATNSSMCSKPIFDAMNGSNSQLIQPEEFSIEAREYLTRYISEHSTASSTYKGAATDPYTVYALLISTALSVVMLAVPFTNFILRVICRLHPPYLKTSRSAKRSTSGVAYRTLIKALMHVCFNVLLSQAFLLPVASLAKNELDRQNAFSTWDVTSNDLEFDSNHVQIIYLFSATSKYNSHFLIVIVVVIFLTIFAISVCTTRRCLQVFARYGILLEESMMMANENLHVAAAVPLTSSVETLKRALKAIEMGEAEYLHLLHRSVKSELKRPIRDVESSQFLATRSSRF